MNDSTKILFERKSMFQTIMSETYLSALYRDFDKLSEKPEDADEFFNIIPINTSNEDLLSYLMTYEYILINLNKYDSIKFQKIHKGTPFYLLGILSFVIKDFERAVFYMDAALSEDTRSYPTQGETPSKLFFALDIKNQNQMALPIVEKIRNLIKSMLRNMSVNGGPLLTHEILAQKLINSESNELRSLATAYLSFILEYEARINQLLISSERGGTGEPFLLHLIKGAIIFESLLANSEIGKKITKRELNSYLKDNNIISNLDLDNKPKNFDSTTYDKLIKSVLSIKKDETKYSNKCIRVTWGVRNLLTHSIGWPKPSIQEYDILFNYIFGAICYAIDGLYSKDSE